MYKKFILLYHFYRDVYCPCKAFFLEHITYHISFCDFLLKNSKFAPGIVGVSEFETSTMCAVSNDAKTRASVVEARLARSPAKPARAP